MSESDTVLYSDAHRWDGDWIDTLYFAAKMERHFYIDSIYDDKKQAFDSQKALLAESGRFQHHRAADDVLMISKAFLHATKPL